MLAWVQTGSAQVLTHTWWRIRAKNYRLHLNRAEAGLRLFESRFGAKLAWTAGVKLINVPLDMVISLPATTSVPFWKISKLRMLLQTQHYATIQILTDNVEHGMEIIVLRQYTTDAQGHGLSYPSLPSTMSPAFSTPNLSSAPQKM